MTVKKLTVIAVAAGLMISASVYVGIKLKANDEVEFAIGQEEYTVNGTTKTFDETAETLPMIDEKSQKLLLPLRWVMEELKGNVEWDKNENTAIIQYQGKTIGIQADTKKEDVNGYSITLADAPVFYEGSIYVTEDFMADIFDTTIIWDGNQKQITLRTEAVQRPMVYANIMQYAGQEKSYYVMIPVMIGLNDANYERNLNRIVSTDITEEVLSFMESAETQLTLGELKIEYTVPYRSKEMISIAFSGREIQEGESHEIKRSINIDLQTQKFVTLQDLFRKKDYMQRLAKECGIDKKQLPQEAEEQFYFDKNRGLVVFWENEQGQYEEYTVSFTKLKNILKNNYQFLLVENQPQQQI